MAKSEPDGCDAHSTRCTQLLIDIALAADHKGETAAFHSLYTRVLRRAIKIRAKSLENCLEIWRR